jgi:hypothetical protein
MLREPEISQIGRKRGDRSREVILKGLDPLAKRFKFINDLKAA